MGSQCTVTVTVREGGGGGVRMVMGGGGRRHRRDREVCKGAREVEELQDRD